ncbi:quinone oxidoreductase family protein [Micromonospora polyrhachis]|nr:zinc-binding dehydrogenase [Micromonospora polyrhachis]
MRAAVVRRTGGPEVFRVEDVPEAVAGPGESLVDVVFAGVNYEDLDLRSGHHPHSLPAVLGVDAVGRRRFDGHRVAVLLRQGGGYAQVVAATDAHTVELPDEVDDQQAAALLEQGATGYGALVLAGRLQRGESVAVSAAAGGVGHLTIQLARSLGAGTVVGLASTPEKRKLVQTLGADVALDPADPQLAERLREATGGGVDLFVDSVGGAVLRSAMRGLRPFGRLVCIGWRDEPDEVSTEHLAELSVGCVGFWMRHVVADRRLLRTITDQLFALAGRRELVARIDRIVALDEVGAAHAAMAARDTSGKVLIDVNREVGLLS